MASSIIRHNVGSSPYKVTVTLHVLTIDSQLSHNSLFNITALGPNMQGHMARLCATSRRLVGSRLDEVNEFFNSPNPSGRTRPWGYSASNRNEYKKQRNNVSGA
jgi:hypothetical protein